METKREIEGLEFEQDNNTNETTKLSNDYESYLSFLLIFLAYVNLIVGLLGAFIFGFAEITEYGRIHYFDTFNPSIFFTCLIGGFFSYAVLASMSKFVEVANKYLSKE